MSRPKTAVEPNCFICPLDEPCGLEVCPFLGKKAVSPQQVVGPEKRKEYNGTASARASRAEYKARIRKTGETT